MNVSDWIQVASLIVAIAAVVVSIVYTQKSIQSSIALTREQIKAQMFSEYTRRYNEIILYIPSSTSEGAVELDDAQLKYMCLYFDLCSEEYHLRRKGIIDAEVWNIWKEGMQITMDTPLYVKAWNKLKGNYNDDFREFFQHEVIESAFITSK